MVSHKIHESKTRRCTYAERTVTAISDIRKRYPRRPIHHNTLKAQIKKNAEAQNDVLGPHWVTYVDAACRALVSQGVFDPHHPPGQISLTPYGKRLIETTRRSSGISENHEHNPECRESLGRKVLHRLSHPSQKSRILSLATTGNERDEREPRTGMTMAELLEENGRLRNEYEVLKSETSHKLAELTTQLENREDELLEYQDKLSGFSDSEWEDANATLVQDECNDLVDTAEVDKTHHEYAPLHEAAQLEMFASSADQQHSRIPANVASHRSPQRPISTSAKSLMRTQSGSFISAISKQPTPAPSVVDTESVPGSPTHGHMDMPESNFVDDTSADMDTSFDPDVTLAYSENASVAEDRLRTPSAARARVHMPTPMSSPQRERRRDASPTGAVRKRIGRLVYERDEETADMQKKLDAKDAALKERDAKIRLLESQFAEWSKLDEDLRSLRDKTNATEEQCKALEDEKTEFLRTVNNLKNQLEDKSAELLRVQAQLEMKEQEAENYALANETEKAHSSDVSARLDEIQQDLKKSENARDALQRQLAEALAETISVRNELRVATADLKARLEDARIREIALDQQVKENSDECEHLHAELQASVEREHKIQFELADLQLRFDTLSLDKDRLELNVSAAQATHMELERTTNALRGELTDVRRELEVERTSTRHLHESLCEVVAQKEGLILENEMKQASLLEAQNALKQKEGELSIARNELSVALGAVGEHKVMIQALQAKVQDGEVQNTQLSRTLRDAEEEKTDLKESYEKLKSVLMAEFDEMDKRVLKKRKRVSMPPQLTSPTSPLLDTDVDVGFEHSTPVTM